MVTERSLRQAGRPWGDPGCVVSGSTWYHNSVKNKAGEDIPVRYTCAAKRLQRPVIVTGNHTEVSQVVQEGSCPIHISLLPVKR